MTPLPSIALVGRPNVGKSRLFNRIVGKRLAIVHDQAGVTRDLAAADVNDHFVLMDTGGIGMLPEMTTKEIFEATEEQVDFAIQAATLVLFITDGIEGCAAADHTIAEKLRRYNKKTLVIVNKMENSVSLDKLAEFYQLGFGDPIAVSAEHGTHFERFMSEIESIIGPKQVNRGTKAKDKRIKICLTGRPNVGKSSLGNCLLNSKRLIVSEVAGTTRDAIETDLDYTTDEGKDLKFRLVDTAGVKPGRKLNSSLEYFSNLRSEGAIQNADIAFLVLDAQVGVAKHDKKLAGDILEAGLGLVIVVNKWDYTMETFATQPIKGFEDEYQFRKAFIKGIRKELFFLPESPVIFTSAKENYAVSSILEEASNVYEAMNQEISTAKINSTLLSLVDKNAPKLNQGKRFKTYYAVQVSKKPVTIRFFCNVEKFLDDTYRRYLESGFHRAFDLKGCPIKFELVGKPPRYGNNEKAHIDHSGKNTLSKHGKAKEKEYKRSRKRR